MKNDQEIYNRLADTWWRPGGKLHELTDFNPLRMSFYREFTGDINGLSIRDVGCGGGLLSEALAEAGGIVTGIVTGIDPSHSSLEAARNHASVSSLTIEYLHGDATQMPLSNATFDLAIASQVLEHIPRWQQAVQEIARVLKPGGTFLFDHPNRTLTARFTLIALGEKALRLIPPGTHDSRMFIRPAEIELVMKDAGLQNRCVRGFMYIGKTGGHHRFRFRRSLAFGYFGAAKKMDGGDRPE